MPTASIQPETIALPSAAIITSEQILETLGVNESDLDVFINETPFLTSTSPDLNLNQNDQTDQLQTVSLDHGYSAQVTKRKLSEIFDENSMLSQDSLSSSFASSQKDQPKKKRTRGIYRAEDVTNEDEYINYLERRKKNNMSSKISRANKKNFYTGMDAKSDQLEKDNQSLRAKIVNLENLNKVLKDYLIQNFASNLPK